MYSDPVRVVGLSLPNRLIQQVDAIADRETISRAAVIRRAIMILLEQEKHRTNIAKRRP
jgi:metal-responsive CopG/Arc/MetJ family transcriptional regulator